MEGSGWQPILLQGKCPSASPSLMQSQCGFLPTFLSEVDPSASPRAMPSTSNNASQVTYAQQCHAKCCSPNGSLSGAPTCLPEPIFAAPLPAACLQPCPYLVFPRARWISSGSCSASGFLPAFLSEVDSRQICPCFWDSLSVQLPNSSITFFSIKIGNHPPTELTSVKFCHWFWLGSYLNMPNCSSSKFFNPQFGSPCKNHSDNPQDSPSVCLLWSAHNSLKLNKWINMPSTRGQAQQSNNTMEHKDSNQEPSKDSAETPPEPEVSPHCYTLHFVCLYIVSNNNNLSPTSVQQQQWWHGGHCWAAAFHSGCSRS